MGSKEDTESHREGEQEGATGRDGILDLITAGLRTDCFFESE